MIEKTVFEQIFKSIFNYKFKKQLRIKELFNVWLKYLKQSEKEFDGYTKAAKAIIIIIIIIIYCFNVVKAENNFNLQMKAQN